MNATLDVVHCSGAATHSTRSKNMWFKMFQIFSLRCQQTASLHFSLTSSQIVNREGKPILRGNVPLRKKKD